MKNSFYIKQEISEVDKVKLRQQLLSQLRDQNFNSIFSTPFDSEKVGHKNCENLIGAVSLPLGIVGPLMVSGPDFDKSEEVLLPIATTEGALVASISRGIKVINNSGGVKLVTKKVGMSRAPVFEFDDSTQALEFESWIKNNFKDIARVTESTSAHLKLIETQTWVRAKYVFVRFVFDTDQAMGMNMVTIALNHLWSELISKKTKAQLISLSSNVCTDKKDSMINRLLGRGYWAQAEVNIPLSVIEAELKTTVKSLIKTHHLKNLIGSNLAGSFSQNMQVANVVAAIFAATGQDLAHVVEASQATTHLEIVGQNLYVSLTIPNLNIGVIGGGNYLPSQMACKQLILRDGSLNTNQFAGLITAASLAGEISGLAALSNHSLAQAHQKLAR